MLTVGIGNCVFHTMCVIIATLFSNCKECKYCTFLFIIILVPVRYVFIKKGKFLYPAFETVHYPSHHELHGIHMINFFSNSWCSKHMGSEAGGFWVVHYRKSRTCKQLSAPSISAAANFSNTRRCSFLCWLLQAGRGLGFPICYTSARLCMLRRDWVYLQWEVPALGAPFFPAPGVWGCSEDA